jgi:type IV pilus assembly protein PilA
MTQPAKRDRAQQGFTLIELLVVVVIIGILAAIAIPVFMNQKAKAFDASVKAQVNSVPKSVETLLSGNPAGVIHKTADGAAIQTGTLTEPITTSAGVHWDIYGSAAGYCVTAWHDNSKTFTELTPAVYDSSAGGLRPAGAMCAPVPTAPDGTLISGGGGAAAATRYAWSVPSNLTVSVSTATTQAGVVRTNLVKNPSCETDVLNWLGYAGDAVSVPSPKATSGTSVCRFTATATAPISGIHQWAVVPVTPGLPYTASMTISVPVGSTAVRPYWTWLNAAVGMAGPEVFAPTSVFPGQTATITISGVAPLTAVNLRLDPRFSSAAKIGDTFDMDRVIVEQSDTVGSYFDGFTTSTW